MCMAAFRARPRPARKRRWTSEGRPAERGEAPAGARRPEAAHRPVLLEQVIAFLAPRSGGHFIDGTVGAGGHAAAILDRTGPDGRLLAIDRDPAALDLARVRLADYAGRVVFRRANFSDVAAVADEERFRDVNGVVADLGVSSMMLDDAHRGFSFRQDGPLDMRMDPSQTVTASDIVNRAGETELADIIYKYGEERRSRPIARAIVRARPHQGTRDVAGAIESVSGRGRHGRIHPATRTFLALRIAVNRELEHLEAFLDGVPALLAEGARLAVISFHSLEDRIVKHRMRAIGRVVTRKVVRPDEPERTANPRSRSAKLRVMERH